jgi:hypothetical protein
MPASLRSENHQLHLGTSDWDPIGITNHLHRNTQSVSESDMMPAYKSEIQANREANKEPKKWLDTQGAESYHHIEKYLSIYISLLDLTSVIAASVNVGLTDGR